MAGQVAQERDVERQAGGVVVGGRQILGSGEDGNEAPELKPPRNFGGTTYKDSAGTIVEIIALGGNTNDEDTLIMSREELNKMVRETESSGHGVGKSHLQERTTLHPLVSL